MEISEQQIEEFMALYRKRFGKDIAREEALIHARKLVHLVRTLRQFNERSDENNKHISELNNPGIDSIIGS